MIKGCVTYDNVSARSAFRGKGFDSIDTHVQKNRRKKDIKMNLPSVYSFVPSSGSTHTTS